MACQLAAFVTTFVDTRLRTAHILLPRCPNANKTGRSCYVAFVLSATVRCTGRRGMSVGERSSQKIDTPLYFFHVRVRRPDVREEGKVWRRQNLGDNITRKQQERAERGLKENQKNRE